MYQQIFSILMDSWWFLCVQANGDAYCRFDYARIAPYADIAATNIINLSTLIFWAIVIYAIIRVNVHMLNTLKAMTRTRSNAANETIHSIVAMLNNGEYTSIQAYLAARDTMVQTQGYATSYTVLSSMFANGATAAQIKKIESILEG